MMESYISDELLIETNHEVLRHLESCSGCRTDMAMRRTLKTQLRHAVRTTAESQVDPIFLTRTKANLKDAALSPGLVERMTGGRFFPARLVAVGFACILLAVTGTFVWMNRSQNDVFVALNNNTEIVNAVRASWAELTSLAVGDHENCAVEYNLTETPITLDEAAEKFGGFNKNLDNVMMAGLKETSNPEVANDIEFIESHSCVYDGRRFAHVVVKHKGKMVSLLMTDTDLPSENGGIKTAVYEASVRAAGLVIGHHAVFIVSQLAESDNVALANAVAPSIRSHVEKPTASYRRIKS